MDIEQISGKTLKEISKEAKKSPFSEQYRRIFEKIHPLWGTLGVTTCCQLFSEMIIEDRLKQAEWIPMSESKPEDYSSILNESHPGFKGCHPVLVRHTKYKEEYTIGNRWYEPRHDQWTWCETGLLGKDQYLEWKPII